jgi:hypothetical protein
MVKIRKKLEELCILVEASKMAWNPLKIGLTGSIGMGG